MIQRGTPILSSCESYFAWALISLSIYLINTISPLNCEFVCAGVCMSRGWYYVYRLWFAYVGCITVPCSILPKIGEHNSHHAFIELCLNLKTALLHGDFWIIFNYSTGMENSTSCTKSVKKKYFHFCKLSVLRKSKEQCLGCLYCSQM